MVIKKIEIFFLLFSVLQIRAYSQECGILDKDIAEKSRKYYLLDSTYSLTVAEFLENVKPKDSALARLIIERGSRDEDYFSFFQSKGIMIKKIGLEQFRQLPRDSVYLSRDEDSLNHIYQKLIEKESELLIAGKSNKSINKELGKSKYIKLHEKLMTSNPFLFKMYSIFHYKNYTLVMFGVFTSIRNGAPFNYEICEIK